MLTLRLPLFITKSCFHCKEKLLYREKLLCAGCLQHLELLQIDGRCRYCFKEIFIDTHHPKSHSNQCQEKKINRFQKMANVFAKEGPGLSLAKALCFNTPSLDSALASFLFLQMEALSWNLPDYITYVPDTIFERLDRGYTPSKKLAQKLSSLINRPVISLLKKEYQSLERATYYTNKKVHAHILLVDAIKTIDTTTALHAASESNPKSLSAITIC